MLANIKTISKQDLFEEYFDLNHEVFLAADRDGYEEIREFLEQDDGIVFVTVEKEDLTTKEALVKAVYEAVTEEESKINEVAALINSIEAELGESQTCVLGFPDFPECNGSKQAYLLELAVVSKAFKLLVLVDDEVFNENLPLWKLLHSKSLVVETDELQSNYIIENEEDVVVDKLEPEASEEKAWYQMIPKYHLGAALVVGILLVALWQMDIAGSKQESLDLNKPKPVPGLAEEVSEKKSEVTQEIETDGEQSVFDQEQGPEVMHEVIEIEPEMTAEAEEEIVEIVEVEEVEEKAIEPIEVVEAVTEEVKEEPVVQPLKKEPAVEKTASVDWSPYQSAAWIKTLNKDHFTLQLMASHNQDGIRNFLLEQGVNSQYAVYTTTKDGKPWHVVIYGTYEAHDLANIGRNELPDYLKKFSPWVRSIADVQKSLP